MKKFILFFLVLLLTGCMTVGDPFNRFPELQSGKGQLIIFNPKKEQVTLRMPVIVLCNDKPCGKVLYRYDSEENGLYTIQNLPEGVIKVSIKNDVNWALGPKISIEANEIEVKISMNRRSLVMIELIAGRESYWGNTLNTADHTYRLREVLEEAALPLMQGLKQPAKF